MKEITRIHLAKVSYDVEMDAKRELEKYFATLQQYTEDQELLDDIEIRMTELLAERGVAKEGVISMADVAAIRQQLGEPQEFLAEGDMAVGHVLDEVNDKRRLYRNTDSAVLGGVLSGIASYLKVNPLWIRLVFLVLLAISFGTAALLYVVLWIVVPPARTAAEKLQLAGQPVTLGSIRELNERLENQPENTTPQLVRRTLLVLAGIMSLFAALGAFIATAVGTITVLVSGKAFGMDAVLPTTSWVDWIWFGLLVIGGLLLTLLFSLLAYMAFTGKATRRLVVSSLVITVVGIVCGLGAVGTGVYRGYQVSSIVEREMKQSVVAAPQLATVTRMKVEAMQSGDAAFYLPITYIVDNNPRYELRAMPNVKPDIRVEGDTATLKINVAKNDWRNHFGGSYLTIYGPALQGMEVASGTVVYNGVATQPMFEAVADQGNLSLSGTFDTVTATGGSIDLSGSTVTNVKLTAKPSAAITAGVVKSLSVTQPDACPADSHDTVQLRVSAVTGGVMQYNGKDRAATTYKTPCGAVIIGKEEEE